MFTEKNVNTIVHSRSFRKEALRYAFYSDVWLIIYIYLEYVIEVPKIYDFEIFNTWFVLYISSLYNNMFIRISYL
jgi:hypothetical protein